MTALKRFWRVIGAALAVALAVIFAAMAGHAGRRRTRYLETAANQGRQSDMTARELKKADKAAKRANAALAKSGAARAAADSLLTKAGRADPSVEEILDSWHKPTNS